MILFIETFGEELFLVFDLIPFTRKLKRRLWNWFFLW